MGRHRWTSQALALVSVVFLSSCGWFGGEEPAPVLLEEQPEAPKMGLDAEEKERIRRGLAELRARQEREAAPVPMGQRVYDFTAPARILSAAELQRLQSAATAGDADACYELGLAYRYGFTGRRDMTAAVNWLEQAAKLGHVQAHRVLQGMRSGGEAQRP